MLAVMVTLSLIACGSNPSANDTSGSNTQASDDATGSSSGEAAGTNISDAFISKIPIEFPLSTDGDTLRIMFCTNYGDANDMVVWNEYEEMTGVNVEWIQVTSSERREKYSAALASGEDLDLIYKCKISQETLQEYGDQGLIVDLADYLEEYAPNIWNFLQNHRGALSSITSPDGEIWSLPQVCIGAETRVSRKLWINREWLDNVGMDIPTTTEEFCEVMKAFMEQDANGNGDPTDEIPFCTQDYASLQDVFFGSFGLGNRGVHEQLVDWDEDNDYPRLIATSESYKDYLAYLNQLYTEGLIDQELFTMDIANWTVKIADNRVGCFANTNLAGLPYNDHAAWVSIDVALEGPNGDQIWSAVRSNIHSVGNAVIPTTCENVGLVLQWLDYFWTDEGALFYYWGVEGETYVVNEDGSYAWADSVQSLIDSGASYDDAVSVVTPYCGGANPNVQIAPYYSGNEMAEKPAAAANALFAYAPKEIWPLLTFTSGECTELNIIKTDINKYITSARIEFITGTKSFDEWDSYVATIEEMGADTLLEIYMNGVKRYHSLLEE